MNIVVFGLSITSSWGNGHATTWRALLRAMAARGHSIHFLERDVPWYAPHRDLAEPGFCRLTLYRDRDELDAYLPQVRAADAVLIGSYVPEGVEIARWVQRHARGTIAFYDIDTPVTLAKLAAGDHEYVDRDVIAGLDLYLSFTGGPTLRRLERDHGAPAAAALYCSVDADRYRPTGAAKRWDLSYLGTYSPDRQPTLERLLIEPARRAPHRRFVVAGPQYPDTIDWPANVERIEHCPPDAHADFYSASRFTLNVTRADMRAAGWSPSVRLFEAGACGAAILSDRWDGIEDVLVPPREIGLVDDTEAVLAALENDALAAAMGEAGRRAVLARHTAGHRAAELERLLLDHAAPTATRAAPLAPMAAVRCSCSAGGRRRRSRPGSRGQSPGSATSTSATTTLRCGRCCRLPPSSAGGGA